MRTAADFTIFKNGETDPAELWKYTHYLELVVSDFKRALLMMRDIDPELVDSYVERFDLGPL